MKAFPQYKVDSWGTRTCEGGMDLRDYFAAKAMQGLLASDVEAGMSEFVAKAYEIADAMMAVRK